MIRSDGLCASGRLFLFLEGKTPPQQKIEGKGHTMTHMLRNRQYVHNLLSQCFVSYGSTNYTALWATGYLGDLSAVLVVDELRRQAVDRRCFKRPSRCLHPPPTFTRRTASAVITVHRPQPLLPSSGFFSRVIHSSHPRHTACLLSQFNNWQRQSLQPTEGVSSNILNRFLSHRFFSAARASGTIVDPEQ